MTLSRPQYADSIAILKERLDVIGDALPDVTERPRHDDEILGPTIFRMRAADVSLASLTLTGLYVGRSELRRVSFQDTELRLAVFNWSDIVECDFRRADLSDADFRACRFVRCDFGDATLVRTDLRGSTFEDCSFDGANFTGAQLYRRPGLLGVIKLGFDQRSLPLSAEQRRVAEWCAEAPEPAGG